MVIETYTKEILGREVTITVKKTDNKEFPYYASCSYKGIDGKGKTADEAKLSCESATKMDLLMN
jgi:nitrite reductase/ring-hydroxylating ferredoxin subunit